MLKKTSSFARYARKHLRDHGVRNTAIFIIGRLYARYHEWRLGIDTRGFISRSELQTGPYCIDYEPIDYATLKLTWQNLTREHRAGAFLDYGSGKGRVVVWAACRTFSRVLGVEKSQQLCQVATENLRRAQSKLKCRQIEIVEADAAVYQIPPDVTAIFLFNPFTSEVLEAVFEQIEASVCKAPRPLAVVYIRPRHQPDPFACCPLFTLRYQRTLNWYRDIEFLVYEPASYHLARNDDHRDHPVAASTTSPAMVLAAASIAPAS